CMLRGTEPLLQLPKVALISRFRIEGHDAPLAVANLHAINFTFGLAEYEAQLDAVVAELAAHGGPIIVAGDFNTWSDGRYRTMQAAMQRLGLDAVLPGEDSRTRVFGRQIDHVFVRGFEVVQAGSPQVQSSDHNPLLATLRLTPR
ncbi:MAG TPA: endonuclease/exonuclease/phosphatase family protein, partial [Burkholderiaceae bacterium]|nr:endonuclease/exonuclease/phosphatase family protein [Burkholderiaceae bacterium]